MKEEEILRVVKEKLERDDVTIRYEYGDWWAFHPVDDWEDECYLVDITGNNIKLIAEC